MKLMQCFALFGAVVALCAADQPSLHAAGPGGGCPGGAARGGGSGAAVSSGVGHKGGGGHIGRHLGGGHVCSTPEHRGGYARHGSSPARRADRFVGPSRAYSGGLSYGGFWAPYVSDPYSSGRIPTPPYFAIHPPVYYGLRVGMPYGDSPFARPPRAISRVTYASPKKAPARPVVINNPYVSTEELASTDKTAPSKPRVILNPYVNTEPVTKTDKADASKPRVILNPYASNDDKVNKEQLAAN